MDVYDQLDAKERTVVDGLIGTCEALTWRQRHGLFMSFAEQVLHRFLEQYDHEDAEVRVNEVLSLTVAAAIEKLGVERCDDGWCALQLLFSAREDHRAMGLRWKSENPQEWAVVEREVSHIAVH